MLRLTSGATALLAGFALAFGAVFVTPQPATAQDCALCEQVSGGDDICTAGHTGWCSCEFDNGECEYDDGFCPGCPADEITRSTIPEDHLREFKLDGRTVVLARLDRDAFAAWGCDDRVSTLVRKDEDGNWRQVKLTELMRRRSELPTWDRYLARFDGPSNGG